MKDYLKILIESEKPVDFIDSVHDRLDAARDAALSAAIKDIMSIQIIPSSEEVEEDQISENVEQLDELSKKTLGSYAKKAAAEHGMKMWSAGNNPARDLDNKDKNGVFWKGMRRKKFHDKAIDKLTKEEVEQLDELMGKGKLPSYARAARSIADIAARRAERYGDGNANDSLGDAMQADAKAHRAEMLSSQARAARNLRQAKKDHEQAKSNARSANPDGMMKYRRSKFPERN